MIKAKYITSNFQDPTAYLAPHHEYYHLNIGLSKLGTIGPNLGVPGAAATYIVLYWDQGKYKRTIRLDSDCTNTATIRSAPGYSCFLAFSANLGELDDAILTYQAPLVSDDEQDPSSQRIMRTLMGLNKPEQPITGSP